MTWGQKEGYGGGRVNKRRGERQGEGRTKEKYWGGAIMKPTILYGLIYNISRFFFFFQMPLQGFVL